MTRKWPNRPTARKVQAAYKAAADLGEIVVVKTADKRSDGSPILGEGQVFVMRTGTRYHTRWCDAVAHKWDEAPRGLLVTTLADVGLRTECGNCQGPLFSV